MKRNNAQYLYMQLADILRDLIRSGTIRPGEFLPSENELSKQYGMSRISVRKSLELLVQEGLIVRKMGQGTIVSPALDGQPSKGKTLRIAATSPSHFVDYCFPWLIREFEQEVPHAKIALLSFPSTRFWESVRHSGQMGIIPDILMISDRQFLGVEDYGAYTDLNKSVRITRSFFYPKLLNAFRHGDAFKGIPVTFSPVFMVYNPALFDRSGIAYPEPGWTVGDLLDVAKRLTLDTNGDGITDQYGLILSSSHTRWSVVALQNGVDFNRLSECVPQIRSTLELIHRLLYLDRSALLHTMHTANKHFDPFLNGKAAMMLTTSLELAHWKQLGIGFEPRVGPLPFGPRNSTLLVANGLMIPEGCSEPELAETFLEFIIRPDIQERLLRRFGFLSVLKPINDQVLDRAYLESANVADMRLEDCHFGHEIFPDDGRIEELEQGLGLFWTGLESVESVIRRMTN